MNGGAATYNERSWAIDLIGHLKHLATRDNRSIKDAGGEQTIKAEGGSLFPDVLLFGDRATGAAIVKPRSSRSTHSCNSLACSAQRRARSTGACRN